MNNLKTMTLASVKEMFENDTRKKTKNSICNTPIIKLIDLINDNSKTITCELTKGGAVLNRGAVVECLINLLVSKKKSASKHSAKRNDIVINGTGLEIKYTNSVAYASLSLVQLRQYEAKQYKPLILVNDKGAYYSNTQYYDIAKNGKVKGVKKVLKQLLVF